MKNALIMLVFFLPPAIFTGFFAFPWGRDQPTEVWALAKIQFLLKPHSRIWDQSGVKELVTITAPKHIDQNFTNGLTQTEASSRLHALADTLDSRGWVTKNVNINAFTQPSLIAEQTSDRLIDPSNLPQEVPGFDVTAADDILDSQNNPVAQHLNDMMAASTQAHHQLIMQQFSQQAASVTAPPAKTVPEPPRDYWFLSQPSKAPRVPRSEAVFTKEEVVLPTVDEQTSYLDSIAPTPGEQELSAELKARVKQTEVVYPHLRVIQPLGTAPAVNPTPTNKPTPAVIPIPDPQIIALASNNDLNVATIAREANKTKLSELSDGEVVISLH
jgi:hypothetical protein